jgi:acyl carrier protein
MTSVASDVIAIIDKKARGDHPQIGLDSRLEDLGLASLDVVEMIFDLEEKFDIEIPYNANDAEFHTVGEVVGAIEDLIKKKKTATQ